MSEDKAAALISVLRSHGVEGRVHDGVVWGRGCYSRLLERPALVLPWERRLPVDGTVTGSVWERIGSSGAEVWAWLGY